MDWIRSEDYAPYFREGLLFIPEKTLDLLQKSDLPEEILVIARRGMQLDDDRDTIGIISNRLEYIMEKLEQDTRAYKDLSSESTQFILSDHDTENS